MLFDCIPELSKIPTNNSQSASLAKRLVLLAADIATSSPAAFKLFTDEAQTVDAQNSLCEFIDAFRSSIYMEQIQQFDAMEAFNALIAKVDEEAKEGDIISREVSGLIYKKFGIVFRRKSICTVCKCTKSTLVHDVAKQLHLANVVCVSTDENHWALHRIEKAQSDENPTMSEKCNCDQKCARRHLPNQVPLIIDPEKSLASAVYPQTHHQIVVDTIGTSEFMIMSFLRYVLDGRFKFMTLT